jgi:hypothetical protein
MDILIHGTKGGRKIFTPKRLSGLLDVTADGAKTACIGKQAYAIRFTADNTIFSKYKIIRDVRGDKRTGFVAFSLFLPNSKKLSGTDIITLLDNVSDTYCQKYIPDNNNLDEVREDWSFLDRISREYENKLKPNDEKMQSGSKDDAFVYFKDTDELKCYFDVPCQEEYSDYRQILFVKEELRGEPENPLNALRHSDNNLTGKIDLENPKYKLLFERQNVDGLNIKVRVKGSEKSNGNKVRKKDVLNINYDQKFRTPGFIRGTWEDIKQNYPNCIEIDTEKETITINPFPLPKDKKIISITVIDAFSKKTIPDCPVIYRSSYDQFSQEVINNQIVFEGDEIGEKWSIEVKAVDYTSYKSNDFKPENMKDSIEIEVRKKHQQAVNDSKDRLSSNDNSTGQVHFEFKAGEHGRLIGDRTSFDRSFPKHHNKKYIRKHYQIKIKSDFGYKFVELTEKEHENKKYILEAQFKPIIPLKFIILGMIGMMVIIVIETVSLCLVLKEDNLSSKENETLITQCTSEEMTEDNTNSGSSGDVDSNDSISNNTSSDSSPENTTNGNESFGSHQGNRKVDSGSAGDGIGSTGGPNIITDIIQYLNGSELDEQKLEEYKNIKGIKSDLKGSIQLCLDFWKLDGSEVDSKNPKTYWNFREKIKKDTNLQNSKLKVFLDKVRNEPKPSYRDLDKKKGLRGSNK